MIDKHRKMGRIEKLKRQAINEANRRVLGEQLRTPPKATGQPIRKSKNQGQVSTETLRKYGEVIKRIKGLGESVDKILNEVSGMIAKLTPPDNRKPNLSTNDVVKEYKEAINKLFKLLERSTPVEESKYGSYRQQEIIPAIKEGMYKGSDLDKLLRVRGFEGIAYEIKGVLDSINKENVIRKQRKSQFTSPADFLLRNPDRIRGIEGSIDDAERDVARWLKEKSKSVEDSADTSSSVDASAAMWKNIQGDSKGGLATLKGEIEGE